MAETMFNNSSHWDPVWTLSLSPFLGVAFLLLLEKWFLSPPSTLPWIGQKAGFFPRIAACLREKNEGISDLKAGYLKFGSKGKFFIKPDMVFKPGIMVPREHIRWILDQPPDVLSVHEARYDKFALDIVNPGHDEAVDGVFLDVIHRKLTRNLLKLQGDLAEEVSRNMDAVLGTDTENWVESNVWSTVENTVSSAVMRILLGRSVCREASLHEDIRRYTRAFGYSSIFVGRILPRFLKPFLGSILSGLTLHRQRNLLRKWFNPMVEERFTNLLKKNQDPSYDYTPPEDLVTWAADALLCTGNAERCPPSGLSRRLAIMIPAALPSIKSTATNAIFDILSAPPEMNLQDHLYNEVASAFDTTPEKGWADQSLLPRLVFLNSATRETMRVNPIAVVVAERKILPKEGVTLPSGQHLPQGTWLGVPTVGVQSDENNYTNAARYEPFRFCNRKPGEEADSKDASGPVISTGMVNVTDTYLPFGAGKFACPGRWLAAHVIKLTIAYLLYNYEIKPYAVRPLNSAIFGTNLPDRQATMMVRRRKH